MNFGFLKRAVAPALAAAIAVASATDARALSIAQTLLPVSTGEIKLGEWNKNFAGGLAIADAYHVPMVVFFGGLSCGKCEMLQRACLTDEFLAWQEANKMVMIFTTDNSRGNASAFAKPTGGSGFPYIAVYWNRDGNAPARNSQYYISFTGRYGEMPVKEGSLATQLRQSIELVTAGYVYDPGLDVGISEHAEMLYSTPTTTKLRYDLSLFTTVGVASSFEPQHVFNAKDGFKVTVKKIAGALPVGVKLAYSDGDVVLTGAPKATGDFTFMFSLVQKRNDVNYEGPPITIAGTVRAADDVAAGGNAMLGKQLKTTLPLFSESDGGKVLAGVLELGQTASGKISAKCIGAGPRTLTFSGQWDSLSGGTAQSVLTSRYGAALSLSLAEGGGLSAALTAPSVVGVLSSGAPLAPGAGSYASAFAGTYTICLPAKDASAGFGAGYVVVKKVAANGKAQWSAGLPDGTSLAGVATIALDGDGNAVLPVFKRTAKAFVAAAVRIRPNSSMESSPRAVAGCEGAVARWGRVGRQAAAYDCDVYGSRYDKSSSLEASCLAQYASAVLALTTGSAGFASGRYGALSSAPSGSVAVSASGMALAARSPDVKLTFSKATGVFKGTMKLAFADGAASAKFAGVVTPGWHGAAEGDAGDPFALTESRPFAAGAVYFSDIVGGASAKRGFAVGIGTEE